MARQTGNLLNQFLSSQFYYDTQKAVRGADSFEVFQKRLKKFHLNTGESHYESYKTHMKQVYDEVRYAWVSPPMFHEFVECAHNMLYYKTDWREPKCLTGQDYYQEDLDEEGYISFCNREDDGVANGDEENQGG